MSYLYLALALLVIATAATVLPDRLFPFSVVAFYLAGHWLLVGFPW